MLNVTRRNFKNIFESDDFSIISFVLFLFIGLFSIVGSIIILLVMFVNFEVTAGLLRFLSGLVIIICVVSYFIITERKQWKCYALKLQLLYQYF